VSPYRQVGNVRSWRLAHVRKVRFRARVQLGRAKTAQVSESGARSHFISAEEIVEAGGPVADVTEWLDYMAQAREWKAFEQASRQLSPS